MVFKATASASRFCPYWTTALISAGKEPVFASPQIGHTGIVISSCSDHINLSNHINFVANFFHLRIHHANLTLRAVLAVSVQMINDMVRLWKHSKMCARMTFLTALFLPAFLTQTSILVDRLFLKPIRWRRFLAVAGILAELFSQVTDNIVLHLDNAL